LSVSTRLAEARANNSKLFKAPGRVNIIGEHTDYNDGLVLPTNTALYTWLTARPRRDRTIQATAVNFGNTQSFSLDDIRRSEKPGWLDYLKGVAAVFIAEGIHLAGADITINGEIPIGSGLSSSASLELAAASALLHIAGVEMPPQRIAVLCQQAEQDYAGVNCGIMDQFSVACCNPGEAMMLDCRSLETTSIALPENLGMLLTNSGAKHQLTNSGYNDRADECRQAVQLIAESEPGVQSLRDVSMSTLVKLEKQLGNCLFKRSRHVVSEIDRVTNAVTALRSGNINKLGEFISASHASLRDDFDVSCDEIETLVGIADACDGVVGSRMVGGGFGGCVLSVMPVDRLDEAISEISKHYAAATGKIPWVHTVSAADPAGEVSE
jgi:galactokinase